MKAWLVFHDTEGRWWSRFLRPGFQHVSVIILTGGCWVLLRPMYARTLVEALPYEEGDMPHTVHPEATFFPITINETERLRSLVGLHTCVSFAKSIMGIRKPWIITPHQLYRYSALRYSQKNNRGHSHGSVSQACSGQG